MLADLITLLTERSYVWPALIAAVAVGVVCALLSVLVVLKRMAFIGQGISHAGFGGVGTAAVLGMSGAAYHWQQDAVVALFCVVTAVAIGALARRKRVEVDSAIGILLAATMAWGVLMQNLRVVLMQWEPYRAWIGGSSYTVPWEQILFGSPLTVGTTGMWTALVMCLVVLATCAAIYKELVFFAFDETSSRVYGVPTGVLYYLVLIMLSLVIVVSIRLMGFILVSALLIVPGAAALMLSRRMGTVLTLAATFGVVGTAGGLLVSLAVGSLSPGACIVGVLFIEFCFAAAIAQINRVRHRAVTI